MFSCEFCEISKKTFFTEHLLATASGKCFERVLAIAFAFKRIRWICFVYNHYWDASSKNLYGVCHKNAWTNVLHTCFTMRFFSAIWLVIIPPRSKIVHCLTHVLFVTLITTKLMVYSIGFSCSSATEGVRLIDICANLAMYSVTFFRSYWPFQRIQFSYNQLRAKFSKGSIGNQRT